MNKGNCQRCTKTAAGDEEVQMCSWSLSVATKIEFQTTSNFTSSWFGGCGGSRVSTNVMSTAVGGVVSNKTLLTIAEVKYVGWCHVDYSRSRIVDQEAKCVVDCHRVRLSNVAGDM